MLNATKYAEKLVVRRSIARLHNSAPGQKPEFWRQPGAALRRRVTLAIQRLLDRGFDGKPYFATLIHDGLVMEVVPGDTIGRAIALHGVYEYAPTELLRRYLRLGDCVVDVGANIGYYTLLGARCVGPKGRVVAFEPLASVRERLLRNLSLNGVANVDVRCEAVGSSNGPAFLRAPEPGNAGTARLQDAPSANAAPVPCVTLDEALDGGVPALIKVDVEGREQDVFAGARRLLARDDAPALLFESFQIDRDGATLEAQGYEIYAPLLQNGEVRLQPARPARAYYRLWEAPNYLAVKDARGRGFARRLLGST